jgi:hypothetical protein
MITPDVKKILGELGKSQYGAALRKFLDSELEDIKDVTTAKSWEEALGNKKAVKILTKLFSFMEEKEVKDKIKNQYT